MWITDFGRMVRRLCIGSGTSNAGRESESTIADTLVASDSLPLYDQESGGLRLKKIIQQLSADGCRIVLFSLRGLDALPGILHDNKQRARYERELRASGVCRFLYGMDELDAYLMKTSAELRYAFISFPHVGSAVLPLLRLAKPDCTIGYDMVDFHALRLRREAELTSSASKLEEAAAMEKIETALFEAADVVFAVSDAERAMVLDLAPSCSVFSLPNAFEVTAEDPHGVVGRKDVLFLGGFWHTPNFDAVEWFVHNIWPIIYMRHPEVRFRIAGSNMGENVQKLAESPGVEIIGYVSDLEVFFGSGRVFVAPLRFGAGVKGKVGQSMAFGLPIVTTSIGAEGMDIHHEKEILVADSAEDFAAAVIRLLENDEDWLHLQKEARAYVARGLSPQSLRITLRAAFGIVPQSEDTGIQSHIAAPNDH